MRKIISLVIPAYNEQPGMLKFHKKILIPAIESIKNYEVELIYVDDGSADSTRSILQDIAKSDPRVRVVCLSRNFGKEIALTAGVSIAKGDAVICLDADGQHPPSILNEFIDKWEKGAKAVVGVRKENTNEGVIKKYGSKLFYKLFNKLSGSKQKLMPRSTDYRLIDKCVQKEFMKFSERNRITRGLIDWLGFKRDYVYFDAPERLAGKANYKTKELAKLALNSFVSLSVRPLLFFGYVGLAIFLLSLILGLFIIIEQYILGDPMGLKITGSASLGIFISCLVGIVLMSQSMISIYLSHIHAQTQGRPLFVIDEEESRNIKK